MNAPPAPLAQVDIWHNVLWARYKAGVFTALHLEAPRHHIEPHIYQIATSESGRNVLAPVDLGAHKYPYRLLFDDVYDEIPLWKMGHKMARAVLASRSGLALLAGYHRPEYWLQLLLYKMKGASVCVFCDSTAKDNARSRVKAFAKRLFFSQVSGVFCYGERSSEYVSSFGVPRDRIFVRCQAAALSDDYSAQRALEVRLGNIERGKTREFLYVGRLSPEKGLDTLLSAFRSIAEEHPEARLKIVGDGPLRGELQAQTQDLQTIGKVAFLGGRSPAELATYYSEALALILPSRSEPWGLVVNEAFSYGCPGIVSDACGCTPELIVEGETGFLFGADDPSELAAKMRLALLGDQRAMSRAAIQHISHFTPQRAAESILTGLSQTMAKARGSGWAQ